MDYGNEILHGGKGSRTGGSSKKRSTSSQAYDVGGNVSKIVLASAQHGVTNEASVLKAEKVEKLLNRKSRCQGSKRSEKRAYQHSISALNDHVYSKGRSTNSSARPGTLAILDIYGLKAKHVDLSRHMVEVSLDELLLGTSRSAELREKNDVGSESSNLEKLIVSVLNCFTTPLAGCSVIDSVDKPNLEGHFAKPMWDLEPSGRPAEKFPEEIPEMKTSKETCAKDLSVLPVLGSEVNVCHDVEGNSSIADLSPKFSLDKLPNYPVEDFIDRLKLLPTALNVALCDSKLEGGVEVADLFGTPISSCIDDYSMPPLAYSPPLVGPVKTHIENDRNGKSGKVSERRWFRGGTNEFDALGYEVLSKKATEDAMKMSFPSSLDSMVGKKSDQKIGENLYSGDHTVSIGYVRATLDARAHTPNGTDKAATLKCGLSEHSEAGLNHFDIVERPIILKATEEENASKLGEEQSLIQAGSLNMHFCNFLEAKDKNFPATLPVPLTSNEPSCAEEPVAYSPRAEEAAWTLCTMSNSVYLEKVQIDRGKRKSSFQPHFSGSKPKTSKIQQMNMSMGGSPITSHAKRDEMGANAPADVSITSEKVFTCEDRKGTSSHADQIIAATHRLSESLSCRPRDFVLLSAVQSGSPTNLEVERQRYPMDPEREASYVDCTVASKTKSLYGPVKPSKESFRLKVKTFTGGPPKQKRVMTAKFPTVSLNSSGSRLLPESSRSSQKLIPSSQSSMIGAKTDTSLILSVKSWGKNPKMEKQDNRQRQDLRLARPSREL